MGIITSGFVTDAIVQVQHGRQRAARQRSMA
jgi:hypothetical protein